MVSLYVRTHWTDQPPPGLPQLSPPPAWTGGYPGPVPLQPFDPTPAGGTAPPPWTGSGPVSTKEEYAVWFPVVAESDLDASGWVAGPGWAGSPPPYWESASGAPASTADRGYGPTATGFRVNRLRLWVRGGAAGSATAFTFTVLDPTGAVLGTVTSTAGWTAWIPVPAGLADGRGIWTVRVNRSPGASVPAPSLYPDAASPANAVRETFVSPYNSPFEGILGVELDGVEITTTPAPTPSMTTVIGACDAAGRRPVTLEVDFAPPLPTGWSYSVSWATALAPPPPAPSTGTVTGAPLPSVSTVVTYPQGTFYPSATVVLTSPAGTSTTTPLYVPSLVVPTCPTDQPCPDVVVTASRSGLCVDPAGTTGPVTFTAEVRAGTPPAPVPWTGPFTWTVRDSAGLVVPLAPPVSTGSTLTTSFTRADRYVVTATIVRDPACEPPILAGAVVVDVATCGCPTILGGLTATRVDGCSFDFSATVVATGVPGLTYSWDFGDGTTSAAAPPLRHTYASGNGPRTVTLTVTGTDGCSTSASTTVTLDCGGGGGCPELASGVSATATAADPCTFDLAVSVSGGTAASRVTWDLPGSPTGPTARVTVPAGTSRVVTATLSSPGCPDRTASTTVSCAAPPVVVTPPVTISCAALLLVALALMLIGTVLAIIGACASNVYVIVAGAIVVAVGLVLFVIWALVCAGRTACSLMRVVQCVLFVLVSTVFPVLVLLLAIFGGIPCGLGAAASWGYWGAILAWLSFIMRRVGCAPTC
ncbi:PKD domain-containing protein [Phycicoccus sonneratiae]|uniref:PKD domain-containing protein n=1 Tax=Phycicoccus sonneratiae TaxID=2807628 RepID=A0ABS2CM18_9MICO|nr:PKD domain-containing protein [Phycicoccus sonneraticus]MBM6400883.1 hypothetical protein [Phycicoccus sonneraticus]